MRLLFPALAAVALLLAAPGDARASEGVKRLGVEAGFAGVSGSNGSFPGFGGAVSGRYDLTDAWALAANVTGTNNQVAAKGGRSWVVSEAVGILYSLDVIQIVPYVGAFVGAYEIAGGGVAQAELKVGGQIALGVGWIVSRDLVLGLELREHVLPADFLASPSNPTPFYTTTFVKAEYAWGWF